MPITAEKITTVLRASDKALRREGKRIGVSGYGNVAWGIMKKAAQLGAKVTYFSGPDGYVHDEEGIITKEKIDFIEELRKKDPMHSRWSPARRRPTGRIQ